MSFLIKVAFWLMILILLLPTDGQQQSQVYGTAEAAIKDIASFCERNPETCANGQNAINVLVQKAEFGARMLMDFVQGRDQAVENAREIMGGGDTMPLKPALWETDETQDTLSTEDRAEDWGG